MSGTDLVAVVIPCYKVRESVLSVINNIGAEVSKIYVVDDCCPDESGAFVEYSCCDERVVVLYHSENKGVGGAVITGYKEAMKDSMSIVVKIDGDGQMDPTYLPRFISPIINEYADYTKGNRFFEISFLMNMPTIRIVGNSILSFINKLSSGYWNIMDPTNGYTAIHVKVLRYLPLDKIDNRYFFESDMLFRLGTIRAVVYDIPLIAKYGNENSNLNVLKVSFEFPLKYVRCFFKRIFYSYFLRDFNAGSVELLLGLILFIGGILHGAYNWNIALMSGLQTATGTIMLAAIPILLGGQLLVSALNYDIYNTPDKPITPLL